MAERCSYKTITLEPPKGHNDAIDFDGAALPGPIPIIENNFFAGSGDDAIDLETDALIVGNTFVNIEKDEFNLSTGDANAISAGAGRNYFVARNVFKNVDHAVQVKDDAFLTFQNNTVVGTNITAIYFDLDDRSPGKGALISDSIFNQTSVTLGSPEQAESVLINNSIVEDDAGSYGSGNSTLDPRFQLSEGDFRLRHSSPAVGTGTLGIDRGAFVDETLLVHGLPELVTSENSAHLRVYAPGFTEFRYRLNGGEWSDALPIGEQLDLTGLPNGEYHVEFVGRDYAGRWQSEDAISAATWTIALNQTGLRINEILAANRTAFDFDQDYPDAIELYNGSNKAIDLSGMRLTDDLSEPARFVFPAGATIDAQGYFVVTNRDGQLGFDFGLNANGETVSLLDASGDLIDSVSFGMQATDFSIGRTGRFAEWNLTTPTIGKENEWQRTGDVESIRINEWLASSVVRFNDDYVELYNPDSLPVDLSGMFITDDLVARPSQHAIAPLSFVGPNDFAVFKADGNVSRGPDHLPFRLRAAGEGNCDTIRGRRAR